MNDGFRCKSHILYVNNVQKTGLCNFYDKRFWKNMAHLKFQMSINVVAYIFAFNKHTNNQYNIKYNSPRAL